MQIIFIHHSCFVAEIDDKVLIFDYFGGDSLTEYHFNGKIPDYAADTEIYMFASHAHRDHFDPAILSWAERYENIHYILSDDIAISPGILKKWGISADVMGRITRVHPNRKYEIGPMKIETLKSCEAGVTARTNGCAFYVELNGVTLFHSGDLADWYWDGIGELMNGRMRKAYRAEIHKLAAKPINAAFVPMDSRQGAYMSLSVDYFLQNTDAEFIFPMHMWQDYSGIREYKKKVSNRQMADRVIEIERENQVFLFGENSL